MNRFSKPYIGLILFLSFYNAIAQSSYLDYTVKTPEVSSLLKVAKPSVNESKGKPNISIPLYIIEAGNMKLPLSLDYNLEGTKVEYESSWVGNSWILNTGGVISRKKIGSIDEFDDFAYGVMPGYNPSTGSTLHPPCTVFYLFEDTGWFKNAEAVQEISSYYKLNGNTNGYAGQNPNNNADKYPDLFSYTLPNGISGSFIFKNGSTIINTGNEKIDYELNSYGIISKFEIIDEFGNRFIFNDYSLTSNDFRETSKSVIGMVDKPSFVPLYDYNSAYPDTPCMEGSGSSIYSYSQFGSIST